MATSIPVAACAGDPVTATDVAARAEMSMVLRRRGFISISLLAARGRAKAVCPCARVARRPGERNTSGARRLRAPVRTLLAGPSVRKPVMVRSFGELVRRWALRGAVLGAAALLGAPA